MTTVPRGGLPGTNFERTFIAIKPDGVQRGKVGNIIARFENKGYKLVALKMMTPSKEKAAGHYADLKSKPFFQGLVDYFSSGPIVAMCWEGVNAIAQGRTLLGATNPKDSLPGTIRGDLCVDIGRNICHGSDGPDSAKHEIEFWFDESEICTYTSHSHAWVYEKGAVVATDAPAGGEKTAKQKKASRKKASKKKKAAEKKEAAAAKPTKKEEAAAAKAADEAKAAKKRIAACLKEGGKKGQDLCGMAAFGTHYFLVSMDEPKGSMEHLQLCMDGANKPVDPDGDDRKGGAADLGKIFFSACDEKLIMMAHIPKEGQDKLTLQDFFGAVLKPFDIPMNVKDEFYATAEISADPDANKYPLKMRDVCIGAGFDFLRSKNLILDDDSDDDINFADACGIDINGGADGDY